MQGSKHDPPPLPHCKKKRPGVHCVPSPLVPGLRDTHLMAHPFHFTRYSMRP